MSTEVLPRPRSLVRRFFDANVRLSEGWERRFDFESDKPFWERFGDLIADEAKRIPDNGIVCDLGGGRRCTFRGAIPATGGSASSQSTSRLMSWR